jgi:hypothetical protein
VNRTGAPGSPAKRCAVNPVAFKSPAFLHGWLTEWQGARLETGGRVLMARGRSIRPPSARKVTITRWHLGRVDYCSRPESGRAESPVRSNRTDAAGRYPTGEGACLISR